MRDEERLVLLEEVTKQAMDTDLAAQLEDVLTAGEHRGPYVFLAIATLIVHKELNEGAPVGQFEEILRVVREGQRKYGRLLENGVAEA